MQIKQITRVINNHEILRLYRYIELSINTQIIQSTSCHSFIDFYTTTTTKHSFQQSMLYTFHQFDLSVLIIRKLQTYLYLLTISFNLLYFLFINLTQLNSLSKSYKLFFSQYHFNRFFLLTFTHNRCTFLLSELGQPLRSQFNCAAIYDY